MDPGVDERSLTVLADPTRVRILRLIRDSGDGRVLVGRTADALGLTQPTVSHHMRVLLDDGIVERHPEGRRVWYSIAPRSADRVDAVIGGPAADPAQPDLERIARDLSVRFRGIFGPETIARCVDESYRLLARGSSSPRLASRTAAFAATRLEALSRAAVRAETGGPTLETPEVLFVCVQNAGRSQMASAILRQLAGGRVSVRTAGSAPTSDVRQTIVVALDEIGVPLGGEFPKPLTDEAVRAADVVVTMGCGDACPVYAGRRYLDWDLDDPVGRPLEDVRRIRDDIEQRVRGLLAEIVGDPAVPSATA
ncbi:metalloregulator ArsR/SmtB family transcription factor [Microbacterium cremeum]|uniref:metalloregulator ArsR/SmtB family transcription factor n=1 Tax=Microbacterium cremeum TaxID=2782169 RepID=UPI0018898DCB|nr:metalloregulator ArsR/SmtB family transcription factor [Microbacterium cremeum]